MDKYQRALEALRVDRTWQKVADILTEGWTLSLALSGATDEVVWPSDAWNVWKGESTSVKVNTALETLGLVAMPGPRYRENAEYPDEVTRQEFRDFYGIDGKNYTFTQWVMGKWGMDKDPHIFRMEDLQ